MIMLEFTINCVINSPCYTKLTFHVQALIYRRMTFQKLLKRGFSHAGKGQGICLGRMSYLK